MTDIKPGDYVVEVTEPATMDGYWRVKAPGDLAGFDFIHASALRPMPDAAAKSSAPDAPKPAAPLENQPGVGIVAGATVRCVDAEGFPAVLTVGRTYEVASENCEWVRVASNDKGTINSGYSRHRFVLVSPPSPDVAALERAVVDVAMANLKAAKAAGRTEHSGSPERRTLWKACEALYLATTPPKPVDPVAELREAAEDAIRRMTWNASEFDKLAAQDIGGALGNASGNRHNADRLRSALAALASGDKS